MDELHFLRPWWLLGAVLCALLAFIGRKGRVGRSAWHRVLDAKLAGALVRTHAGRHAMGATGLLWLMLCLGMLALAGPTWNRQLPDELRNRAAVIVLLGNGNTMYAGDIAPNRNRAAKGKIGALRRLMPQASFSVIAYASTAHLVIPLTRDDSFFDLFLQPLEPDIMPATTLPRSGLGQALDLAKQAAGAAGMPANVILMTDSLSARERADLSEFHKGFPSIEVLVVGTGQGGALRFAPAGLALTEGTAVPMDDFAALKGEGVPVTGITADDQDVAWLVNNIRGTIVRSQNGDGQWHWQDSGYWLVLAMLPLGLLLYRRLSLVAPLMLVLASAYTPPARADWQDLWWTPDQQGQRAMDRGDYRGAAERFADPYRKGRAYYLAKDYAQAAAAFRQVATAQGNFYLANSLAQQQQYQAALKHYRQALLIDPALAQASTNAQAVKAVLDELAKHPGERRKADPGNNDFTSIRIDLKATRQQEEEASPAARAMSEDELNNWMANVKSSPRDMLKALFILQAQERYLQEKQ
ncbi:hypothetical protein D9M70_158290 [compost metagenome]